MKKRFLPFLLFTLFLNSCIGISMDIQMRKDGSGRINMEYRISNMAETIGKLDGNENWPVIPVGRSDLERSIMRIPGMKIASYSLREGGKDTVITAAIEYENTAALMKFLDPAGKNRASFNKKDQLNTLEIIINDPASLQINADLIELIKQNFLGYNFSISFSADKNSSMIITDGGGREITPPPALQLSPSGKKVSLSIEMAEILSLKDGLGLRFTW